MERQRGRENIEQVSWGLMGTLGELMGLDLMILRF